MKLQNIRLHRYLIPLIEPLFMKGVWHKQREGLLVEIFDDHGFSGLGDAAPFPGLHRESVEEVIEEVKNLRRLTNLSLPVSQNFREIFQSIPECSPSFQFAFEWAITDLLAKSLKTTPAKIINPKTGRKIKLNALITGNLETSLNQAHQIYLSKYDTVKIKVGVAPVENDIKRITALNKIFKNKLRLRLDANRNWTFAEALKFGNAMSDVKIDYIEEPVDDPRRFPDFYNETGVSYAFDETLTQSDLRIFNNFVGLSTLVIKPALVGGFNRIFRWLDFAETHNLDVIFSSTFESDVGLWAIASLAGALGTPGMAVGLDTYKWLEQSICIPPFTAQDSEVLLPEKHTPFEIKKDMLTPIQL